MKLADLQPATATETMTTGPRAVKLACRSGACLTVDLLVATGRGISRPKVPTTHWETTFVPMGFADGPGGGEQLLAFRRALARVISPDHSDREVCEAADQSSGTPHCSSEVTK